MSIDGKVYVEKGIAYAEWGNFAPDILFSRGGAAYGVVTPYEEVYS